MGSGAGRSSRTARASRSAARAASWRRPSKRARGRRERTAPGWLTAGVFGLSSTTVAGVRSAMRPGVVAVLVLGLVRVALAHPLAPCVLELRETPGGVVEVGWKTPLVRARGAELEPVLPARCRPLRTPKPEVEGGGVWRRWTVDCGRDGLVGQRVVATVTAFTFGYSITLTLAALGLIVVPSRPIEVAIATTVLAVAVELARPRAASSLARRRPWLMAATFGLLHGLGFAAALREA